jgi:branched-chain amino acid transport system permease protein
MITLAMLGLTLAGVSGRVPQTSFIADSVVTLGLFAILALSLNIQYGFTGLINFGTAAFYMIGAYTASLISFGIGPFVFAGLGENVPLVYSASAGLLMFSVSVSGAILVSALAGFLVSLPSLRLREDYLAIITLVFAEIIRVILRNTFFYDDVGGILGLRHVPSVFPVVRDRYELYPLANAIFVMLFFVAFYLVSNRIVNSPYGRVMRSIREDEIAAKALGKDTFRVKAQVFAVGSAMAGASGALLAQYLGYTSTDLFLPFTTFQIYIIAILGGVANNNGAILGAGLFVLLNRGTNILKDYFGGLPLISAIDPLNVQFILTGLLLVLFMMFRPEGLLKESRLRTVAE